VLPVVRLFTDRASRRSPVRSASDYLDISSAEARSQWLSVLDRKPVIHGRQVDFVPAETIMCLAASLVVNHRRYGGTTSKNAEAPVPQLARLFRRPNSSILAKMANLDGSRRNGATHEIEVAARLLGAPERLAALYRCLVAAAREVGVSLHDLPDFLLLEQDGSPLLLLGQEELEPTDLESSVEKATREWLASRPELDERTTERLLLGAVRVGQHRFATDVLRNHAHRCAFCGLSVAVSGVRARRMLVASHIKPWKVSNNAERLDARNGVAACPTHDVAFDTGLLTVNGGLRIHLSKELERAVIRDGAARAAFGRPPLYEKLMLPVGGVRPDPRYLDWHRDHIYVDTWRNHP